MAERHIVHVKDVFPATAAPPAASGGTTPGVDGVGASGGKSARLTHGKKRRAPDRPPPTRPAAAVSVDAAATGDLHARPTTDTDMLARPASMHSPAGAGTPCGGTACLCTSLVSGGVPPEEAGAVWEESLSGSSSGYQSELATTRRHDGDRRGDAGGDEGSFSEEECAMELEEEDAEGRYTALYKEYHGEDFAQYLVDDSDRFVPAPRDMTSDYVSSMPGPLAPGPPVAYHQGRTLKNTIKHRFSKMFTMSRSRSKPDLRAYEHTIYDFTYRDAKIAADTTDGQPAGSGLDGGGDRDAEDDGGYGGSDGRNWWSVDTLSARAIGTNDEVLFMAKKPSSCPTQTRDDDGDDDASLFVSKRPPDGDFDGPPDFESTRKSTLFRSNYSTGARQLGKKKPAVWDRLRNSLRRLDRGKWGAEHEGEGTSNVVSNPLHATGLAKGDQHTYL